MAIITSSCRQKIQSHKHNNDYWEKKVMRNCTVKGPKNKNVGGTSKKKPGPPPVLQLNQGVLSVDYRAK